MQQVVPVIIANIFLTPKKQQHMAKFDPTTDFDAQTGEFTNAAVEQAPAQNLEIVDVKTYNRYNQTVRLLSSAKMKFSQHALIILASAAKLGMINSESTRETTYLREAVVLNKLLFAALGTDLVIKFPTVEIRAIIGWLKIALNSREGYFGKEDIRFEAQMLLLDLREMIIPEIVEEDEAAIHAEINRQANLH